MSKRLLFFALLLPLLHSCASSRKAIYFNELKDSTTFQQLLPHEHVIQNNDLLSIKVSSQSLEADKIFNETNRPGIRSTTPTGEVNEPAGYLVDKQGNIQFLILGTVKAEGLTNNALQTYLSKQIKDRKLLVDPVVEVRLLNYKVTVIGEVAKPTVISVPNEKITLLEALGLAGDMSIYGNRTNVLVIREQDGVRSTKRINLNSTQLFNSPFYYLKANDIVYVEPNKARIASGSRFNQNLPAIISALSVVIIVIDRLTSN